MWIRIGEVYKLLGQVIRAFDNLYMIWTNLPTVPVCGMDINRKNAGGPSRENIPDIIIEGYVTVAEINWGYEHFLGIRNFNFVDS